MEALRAAAEEKREAYHALKESSRTEERAAKRAIEDALPEQVSDNSMAIHQISIKNLNKQLQKLLEAELEKE